jgi:hypothetical protein
MNHPDPVLHKRVSFVKSAVRIAAGIALIEGGIMLAGALLIIAEGLGIFEEMV